jgi:hypothetical protein
MLKSEKYYKYEMCLITFNAVTTIRHHVHGPTELNY